MGLTEVFKEMVKQKTTKIRALQCLRKNIRGLRTLFTIIVKTI